MDYFDSNRAELPIVEMKFKKIGAECDPDFNHVMLGNWRGVY